MKKKIFQTIILVLLVTCLLTALALCYSVDKYELELKKVIIISLVISCTLIFFVNRVLKYMSEVMYLNSPLSKIDKMVGEEFEYYLKLKLQKLGYKVEITPKTGDYGADLFCFRGDETIVVQAKRYEGNVGTAAVQEVTAAREYYEAGSAVVITNSYFTLNALNLAEANKVALIDRDDLLNFRDNQLYYTE